jgi:uncharacterized lipoprotein YajG
LHKPRTRDTFARALTGYDYDAPGPVIHRQLTPEGMTMKTILMLTALVLLAGCEKKGTTSGAQTDSTAAMDSTMTHADTSMAHDTTAK